jgi:hypothetical protein
MPTYRYDERVKVCEAMAKGSGSCPRCGAAIEERRLQTTQDKVLKRPGKVAYRCTNTGCACECTPFSHLTATPLPPPPTPPKS